ncbi:hypothetical protein COOONC_01165 [Cooperia oncophora]
MPRKHNQRPLSLNMHVPEHISVTGQPLSISRALEQGITDHERAVQLMNVPDRIVLTGGNSYKGFTSQPTDLMENQSLSSSESCLLNVPPSITLHDIPAPDLGDEANMPDESARCDSSMAIDENPIRELKIMRRQIGGLSSRLYQLEDELHKYRSKEKLLLTTIFGIATAFLLALFKK